jgi:hypothetical protein
MKMYPNRFGNGIGFGIGIEGELFGGGWQGAD